MEMKVPPLGLTTSLAGILFRGISVVKLSVVELRFAKEVRVSQLSCSRQRGSRTPTVSPPFAKGETKRGWIPARATPDSDPGLPGMTLIQPISKNTTLADLTRQIIYTETANFQPHTPSMLFRTSWLFLNFG